MSLHTISYTRTSLKNDKWISISCLQWGLGGRGLHLTYSRTHVGHTLECATVGTRVEVSRERETERVFQQCIEYLLCFEREVIQLTLEQHRDGVPTPDSQKSHVTSDSPKM